MGWLNYHHLLYFWVTARHGGLTAASAELRLAKPTLSGQIRALEDALGEKLFTRAGRRLVLTDAGRLAYRYADEIFSLGREMQESLAGRGTGRQGRLNVGVADVLPKLVVRRLLQPAVAMKDVQLVCHEDTHAQLLARLAEHELDIALTDAPVPPGSTIRAFNHPLGDCGLTWFGTHAHRALKRGFPRSLDGAPVLLPIAGTSVRRAMDQWFSSENLRPAIVAEFEDSALMKVFGADGLGVFAAPQIVEPEVCRQYGVTVLGRTTKVREAFFAISVERRIKHPATVAIMEAARSELFAKR